MDGLKGFFGVAMFGVLVGCAAQEPSSVKPSEAPPSPSAIGTVVPGEPVAKEEKASGSQAERRSGEGSGIAAEAEPVDGAVLKPFPPPPPPPPPPSAAVTSPEKTSRGGGAKAKDKSSIQLAAVATELEGKIESSELERALASGQSAFQKCLTEDSRVTLSLRIQPSGEVTNVSSSRSSPDLPYFRDCVVSVVKSLRFPAPKGHEAANLTFDLALRRDVNY